MNIEIIGVWPFNKGAVLMLEAIRARVAQEFPGARFAVPVSWPVEERLALGLWATASGSSLRPSAITLLGLAPRAMCHQVGFLPGRDIDVLLDASGFGYGDYWGLPKLRDRLTRRVARWQKDGRRAILLPQALGPFEGPGMAQAFRSALDRLDLTFVRDATSERYVNAVAIPGRHRIRRAPDFTNLLKPELPARLDPLRGRAMVIPNEKMVAGRTPAARRTYLRFLATAISEIRGSGREPVVLVHEGSQDRGLADELNTLLERPAEVVEEPSALVTKAIISVAEIAVSSRYHGLVSALSSSVPSLACGWSHKYVELMTDYGCPDLVVDVDQPESWVPRLRTLMKRSNDEGFRRSLGDRAAAEKTKSERMWADVLEVIR